VSLIPLQDTPQTSMPPVGFEPAIPAVMLPQTYALDRAATGISLGPKPGPRGDKYEKKHERNLIILNAVIKPYDPTYSLTTEDGGRYVVPKRRLLSSNLRRAITRSESFSLNRVISGLRLCTYCNRFRPIRNVLQRANYSIEHKMQPPAIYANCTHC
jgi:hypothetical protein